MLNTQEWSERLHEIEVLLKSSFERHTQQRIFSERRSSCNISNVGAKENAYSEVCLYKSIQGCRAIAALLVVLFHLGGVLSLGKYFGAKSFAFPTALGDCIGFFFVLSGFIITWIHAQDFGKPDRLWSFVRKRAIRVYPSYWLFFLSIYFLSLMVASPSQLPTLDFTTIFRSLILWPQDPAVVGGTGAPVLVVAWTLQYEIVFYAVVAVFIFSKLAGFFLLSLLAVNYGVCQAGECAFPQSFFARNWMLLFGYGAVIAYICKSSLPIRQPLLVSIAGIVGFVAIGLLDVFGAETSSTNNGRMVYGLLGGIIILGLVRAEDGGQLRINWGRAAILGDASYALYLIHFPLISALCKLAIFSGLRGPAGAAISYFIILGACIVSALTFHILVERPVLKLFSKRRLPALNEAVPSSRQASS